MKEKHGMLRKIIKIGYFLLLGGMILLVVLIRVTKDDSGLVRCGKELCMLEDGWTLDEAGTQPADLSRLGSYVDPKTGRLTIYHQLPELKQTTGMIYRTKDVSTRILSGQNVVYETNVADSRYYNRSPGNLWNFAYFDPEDSHKTIAVEIIPAYDARAVTFDSVYWGMPSVIIIHIIREKLAAIVISLLMIVLGFLIFALGVITQKNLHNGDYSSHFLGIYATLAGIWSLLETNVLQLVVTDMRIIQTLDNITMIIGVLPLFIYMDYKYHILDSFLTRLICIADFIYVLFSILLQFSGWKDFHEFLIFSQFFTMAGSLIVLWWVAIEWRRQWKEHHRIEPNLLLRIIGISTLLILIVVGVVQYTQTDVADRAQWIRAGMLVFLLCFGSCNLMETYNLIAQGVRYDIMEHLAYMDGLTGVGNRTAYLEQIDAYAKNREEHLGIVFMDINDLKLVNDRIGHEAGDALLKRAAGIISDSFGRVGHVYRTGGDEFCALIAGPEPQQSYQEALAVFRRLIEESARGSETGAGIQIAQGFACCEHATEEKLREAVEQADKAMYAEKKRQKKAFVTSG